MTISNGAFKLPFTFGAASHSGMVREQNEDAFALDDRSLLIAQAQYEILPFLYVVGRFTRRWVLQPVTGTFMATDDWNFGVEVAFEF